MAKAVESLADICIVTDDNPRREDPAKIRRGILRGFQSFQSVKEVPDRAAAIEWALRRATTGDCVLIAGKGHEDYQQIGATKRWFDDRQIARQRLYDHAVSPQELLASHHRLRAG